MNNETVWYEHWVNVGENQEAGAAAKILLDEKIAEATNVIKLEFPAIRVTTKSKSPGNFHLELKRGDLVMTIKTSAGKNFALRGKPFWTYGVVSNLVFEDAEVSKSNEGLFQIAARAVGAFTGFNIGGAVGSHAAVALQEAKRKKNIASGAFGEMHRIEQFLQEKFDAALSNYPQS